MNIIFQLIALILSIFQLLLLARALLSFFPQLAYSSNQTVRDILRLIYNLTEPVLAPVRQFVPPSNGVDFSPLIVLIVIYLILQFIR